MQIRTKRELIERVKNLNLEQITDLLEECRYTLRHDRYIYKISRKLYGSLPGHFPPDKALFLFNRYGTKKFPFRPAYNSNFLKYCQREREIIDSFKNLQNEKKIRKNTRRKRCHA